MLPFDLAALPWIGVLIATVSVFVLGGIWYSALFSKAWIQAHGFTKGDLDRMAKEHSVARVMTLLFLSDAVSVVAMALAMQGLGSAADAPLNAGGGAAFGLLVGAGVAGTQMYSTTIATGKKLGVWAIEGGKAIAGFVLIGAILGALA